MDQNIISFTVKESFNKLINLYSFRLKQEINDGQTYSIDFSSKDFVIKVEKYFREFYVSLHKITDPDNGINLFNLLEYLKEGTVNVPKSEYFRKEKDIEECYKKQLNHISTVIYENYSLISDFFSNDDYEIKILEFEKYWKNKHPEFYQ